MTTTATTLLRPTAVALAAGLLLAACGGGGGGGGVDTTATVPGTEVPTTATSTASGATDFVARLAGASSETAEPVPVGDATLATSETDEPRAL